MKNNKKIIEELITNHVYKNVSNIVKGMNS